MGIGDHSAGLRIVVDARALHHSGIGRYLREVLTELLRDRRFGEIQLLGDPAKLGDFVASQGATAEVRIEAHRGGFYTPQAQLSWQSLRRRGRITAKLALFPHYDAPIFGLPPRSVVAIQDLTHFKVPAAFPGWKRAGAAALFDRVVRRAEHIVVSSSSTRADLLERMPAADRKVEVIPLGVSASFGACHRSGCTSCASTRELQPYLLCVGNRKPHKNLSAAVKTLALLRRDWPQLRLVVAGQAYPHWQVVLSRAEALGVREALVEFEDVPDARLRCLYSHAEALLFPSYYEGFGLPVLEAMACGIPVVASNRASIPEVVGDAGLLVDPDDPSAMAAAVGRLRDDRALRQILVERGGKRAGHLSWERAARQTVSMLFRVGTHSPAVMAGPVSGRVSA